MIAIIALVALFIVVVAAVAIGRAMFSPRALDVPLYTPRTIGCAPQMRASKARAEETAWRAQF